MRAEVDSDFERPGWWRRWIVQPLVGQLTQGSSPEHLAWTISAGVVLGLFPIMGTTTLVCAFTGWVLGLNQPVLHLSKAVVYPLHLGLILVFIRTGEWLFGAPLIAFSIPELMARFKVDPLQFARDFGLAAVHGVVGWTLVAPFLGLFVKMAAAPLLRRLADRLNQRKEAAT